jgi:hypothetical protein
VAPSENRGRGVFTSELLLEGQAIEISPVLVLSLEERKEVEKTRLHDYIFEWGNKGGEACVAWGYLSIYNHATEPNCRYEMDYEHQLITIRTLRTILVGEELFINYLPEEGDIPPIWFTVQ